MNNCTLSSAEKSSCLTYLAKGASSSNSSKCNHNAASIAMMSSAHELAKLNLIDLDVLRSTINFNCIPMKISKKANFPPNCFQTSKALYQNECHKNDIVFRSNLPHKMCHMEMIMTLLLKQNECSVSHMKILSIFLAVIIVILTFTYLFIYLLIRIAHSYFWNIYSVLSPELALFSK